MCEVKQNLKALEDRCKIFHNQQFIFIAALDRCRENAHDTLKSVRNLAQVQYYLESHCKHLTDRRIIKQFLDLCRDLFDFVLILEKMETDARSAGETITNCKMLLSLQNDLSCIRARFPHDEVNHLSINEAKNYYGGIVSLIPTILDNIRLGIATLEKPQPTPRVPKASDTCPIPQKAEPPIPVGCHNTTAQTDITAPPQPEKKPPKKKCSKATRGVRKLAYRALWKPNGGINKF